MNAAGAAPATAATTGPRTAVTATIHGGLVFEDVVRRVLHPPLRDARFWPAVVAVVVFAGIHLHLDDSAALATGPLPAGTPVALLLIPVLYAALRYGMAGSIATGGLATLLWLPDLLLPGGRGHPESDVIELLIIDAVAVFVGLHLEREEADRRRAETAEAARRLTDRLYHDLFRSSLLPIVLVDGGGAVVEANAAARALFGEATVGRPTEARFGISCSEPWPDGGHPPVPITAADGATHIFRPLLSAVRISPDGESELRQLVFQDVSREHGDIGAARSYAGLLLGAQENERSRIARDLHDDPLQRLINLARRMEAMDHPDSGAAHTELLEVIGRLRDITRGLRPPGLDQFGLVAAVRGLLHDLDDTGGASVDLAVTGTPLRLPPEIELCAYRITQEAVRNAIRHAHASSLHVELAYDGDGLRIGVRDDGQGFRVPPVGTPVGRHVGLLGMRERTSLLGGVFTLASAPGAGTSVDVLLPLSSGVAAEPATV